ncbi:MAG TPA: hypothetical protein VLU95_01505 [Candidatus Acidoferrum sp.]|nr:hypothetical protein [Candidatus Acidoferrum sp.]
MSSPIEVRTNLTGEAGYSVFQLVDGSLILNTADQNCTYLIKIDSSNHLLWTKTIQIDQKTTVLSRLLPTSDGGYVLAGIVDNFYSLVKTNSLGNVQWTKMFSSGAPVNYFMSITQTNDGGFAIAGFGEKVEESEGWIWFAKTDSLGNMEWNETISGPNADCPSTIFQTSDGGYVLSDVSYSFVPNQAFFALIKMDANGKVLGKATYGGEGYYFQPECNIAITTKDGGYLMAGYLWQKSAWILKTDSQYNMQWNQTFGTDGSSVTAVLETQEGGFLLVNISNLKNAGLIMTDKLGNQLWNMTLPGVTLPVGLEANFNSIINVKDGGFIMIGSKNNSVWLAKLDYQQDGSVESQLFSITNLLLAVVVVIIAALTIAVVRFKTRKKVKINNSEISSTI